MTVARRLLVLAVFVSLAAAGSAFASAANIYITQSGSPSGSCTSNTQAPAFFNTASNWGSGATQIGPGTTVLICGTITGNAGATGLTVQGSGTSSSPITILFDTNAVLQAPYWNYGISISGQSNIVVNGGSNGIIQNSGNGTGLANSNGNTIGVYVNAASNVLVENLTIQNLYLNAGSASSATDSNGVNSTGVRVAGNSPGFHLYNCKISNASIDVSDGDTASGTNAEINNNVFGDSHWTVNIGGAGTSLIHNNTFTNTNWTNWQYPTSTYHTDGIIAYGDSTVITPIIYDNTFTGSLGAGSPTGFIFCTYGTAGNGSGSACTIFNNVFVGQGYQVNHDSAIYFHANNSGNPLGPHKVYNNTFVNSEFEIEMDGDASTQYSFENNVFIGEPGGTSWYYHQESYNQPFNTLVTVKNNVYYQGRSNGPWNWNGATYSTLAAWQAACNCDGGAVNGVSPNLNASYQPQSGSPVISAGANLTSLGITALDSDQAGNSRPATGAWDSGAFEYASGTSAQPPAAPASVTVTVTP